MRRARHSPRRSPMPEASRAGLPPPTARTSSPGSRPVRASEASSWVGASPSSWPGEWADRYERATSIGDGRARSSSASWRSSPSSTPTAPRSASTTFASSCRRPSLVRRSPSSTPSASDDSARPPSSSSDYSRPRPSPSSSPSSTRASVSCSRSPTGSRPARVRATSRRR